VSQKPECPKCKRLITTIPKIFSNRRHRSISRRLGSSGRFLFCNAFQCGFIVLNSTPAAIKSSPIRLELRARSELDLRIGTSAAFSAILLFRRLLINNSYYYLYIINEKFNICDRKRESRLICFSESEG
jgi:hypothetical protein